MREARGKVAAVCLICLTASVGLAREPRPGASARTVIGWRGDGTGRYPDARPPTEWDADDGTNILWQAEVGKSQSSPVAAGQRIFVTAEQDLLLCLDRKTGKVLWKRDNGPGSLRPADRPDGRPPAGPGGGYSIPTPVTDGRFVYVSYGTGIVACCDMAGGRKWIRIIKLPQVTEYGRAASPLLVGGKLLVSIGALIALDPETGKTLWQAKEAEPSYGTPAVASVAGAALAVTPKGDCVGVSDGRIVARGLGSTTYSSPVVHAGVVYFAGPPVTAVKLSAGAEGRIQPRKLWEIDDVEGEFYASPVFHEGVLYCATNEGMLLALDARTGRTVFRRKLKIPSAGSPPGEESANIYPSLTLAGKHLLLGNDIGNMLVLAPRKACEQVALNYLDAGCGACPTPDGKLLLLRAGKKLYCIGRK